MSRFELQTTFEVDDVPAKISKWRSPTTGLQLIHIDMPSTRIDGKFDFGLNFADNSICHLALKRLVFMGSKKYPYKGVLKSLEDRCFSQVHPEGVYYITSNAWEGLKKLLPIFSDHLFYPTLTDEAFLTEAYHIDGEGRENGAVYSKALKWESSAEYISEEYLWETLYAADFEFSIENNRQMTQLRSLKPIQVRDFHKENYRPENCCVMITGSVDEEDLLQIMSDIDTQLLPLANQMEKQSQNRQVVDWVNPLPLAKTIVKTVEFPGDDESMAELKSGWIVPESVDTLRNVAIDMVCSFLTESPISPFTKHFLKVDDPLATEISCLQVSYRRLDLSISGIPSDKLDEVYQTVKALLVELTNPTNVDLKYMADIINEQMNEHSHGYLFSRIADLNFHDGRSDGSTFRARMNMSKDLKTLITWSAQQWSDLIKTYFVENHSATILSKPSSRLKEELEQAAKKRRIENKEKYGEKGLQELKQKLERAQAVNEIPTPDALSSMIGRLDSAKIYFIKTECFAGGSNEGNFANYKTSGTFADVIKKDQPEDFPLYLHFENYNARYIDFNIMMSTTTVPSKLLKYFAVFKKIFSMSIQLASGEYVPYDEVQAGLEKDLKRFDFNNTIHYTDEELLEVKFKFAKSKYKKAIQWLINVFTYSVFEASRIQDIVENILRSLPKKRRCNFLMLRSLQCRTLLTDPWLRKASDFNDTEEFYKDILERIK